MTTAVMGRLLLGGGAIAALAISPVFALAYHPAFGGPSESPPGWLGGLEHRFVDWGWLSSGDAEGLYATYGLWYAALLVVVVIGLVLMLTARCGDGWSAGGWGVVVAGLALAALGTFGDYSLIDALSGLFLMELLGALLIAVGTVMIGVRLWRSGRRTLALVGLVGPVSLVLGSALFGHFPSGPLSIDLVAGAVIAATGLEAVTDPG